MPTTLVPVALSVALVALLPACGPRPTASTPPDAGVLQGNIDTRPFVARSGFAHPRKNDDDIDIFFYEEERTASEACAGTSSPFELDEAERLVWVQMPWPVAEGTEGQSIEAEEPNYWGMFFQVQRGHGSTATRATGTITVERAQPSAGTLHLDVATENTSDLHGSVRGAMAFSICPR